MEYMGTIGWIKPGAIDKAINDVFAMTPPDVNLSVLTSTLSLQMMNKESFDKEAFHNQHRASILESVRNFIRYANLDFIAVTGDLIQSAMGFEWDRELRDAIQEVSGRPGTTAMTAVTDALEHLGAGKVAVASPYRDSQNEYVRMYLEAAGFQVTAMEGQDTHSIKDVKRLPEDTPLIAGLKAFQANPGAEALYIPCPCWRVGPHIEKLEKQCGVPVLTMLNTFIWKGLSVLGHHGGVTGSGQLLKKVS